ncbi:oocyte zinc finger protein XlCOF29-like [Anomaloglossus baeobatrachus]|uniref:oocyte zinc finger protein XlCOF29-like n=1 Tax=Anomaloglossus baeobatrachus TaxID=238106 RepID=UPI003F4FD30D
MDSLIPAQYKHSHSSISSFFQLKCPAPFMIGFQDHWHVCLRDMMAERILHLTLEILFRLTGEDYTVVKKTSSEGCQAPVSEGWGRPLSPITGPPPHPPIHEDINDQKILELTYKMIELLTGEVTLLGMLGHYTVTL